MTIVGVFPLTSKFSIEQGKPDPNKVQTLTFAFSNKNLKKVLIIRFSSIGDIVLTTPVVRCLKARHPEMEIHYLTKSTFAPILQTNPHISRVHLLEKNLNHTISALKKEEFNYVIDLHHNLRSMRVKMALGIASRSFSKLNWEKWLLVNFKVNRLPKVHIVDRYLQAASAFDIKYDGKGLDYFIPDKDKVDIVQLPTEFQNGFVAFVIGAKHATKRLPEHKMIEFIRSLQRPVVLLGGKEDIERGEAVVNGIKTGAVFNGCGKYSLNGSASLIEQSELVITHDTGLMHIAAALRKKIISIWGNTVPEFGMYPFLPYGDGESVILENKTLDCRPCSKIGYDRCPKKHFRCMNDLVLKLP